jgi:hypothetical protein
LVWQEEVVRRLGKDQREGTDQPEVTAVMRLRLLDITNSSEAVSTISNGLLTIWRPHAQLESLLSEAWRYIYYEATIELFILCTISVADPGSGAFLPPGPGIRDKQTKFVNSLYTKIGRIRCFFTPRIRDGVMVGSGSGIKHPGSTTLITVLLLFCWITLKVGLT